MGIKKIFINPEHAPDPKDDPGAVNARLGLKESVVARRIAERVATYLAIVNYDVKVFQYDGLREICDRANHAAADLFVSIHCNAFDGRARGTETYCTMSSRAGSKLARCIHNQIVDSVEGIVDRGVREAGYYVLIHTEMPAVLVETAFIDNDADAELLVEKEDEFARAIARGITDYCHE